MTAKKPDISDFIDSDALRHELTALTAKFDGDGSSPEIRAKVLARLKEVRGDALEKIEKQLFEDGQGTGCARRISAVQDEIIRVIYDFAFWHVYRVTNPSSAERMAIVAVGGYGRGTLAPGSDIDLLFLLPYKQTPWGESVVEYILYMLWDMGLKVGHATRQVDDCIRLSKEDMTIRTSILEARLLWGEESLFDDLLARFEKSVVKGSTRQFVEAKLAERDARHERQGQSRYLVEPNVKEGKGGLRDLHTLFWIAKYHYRVKAGRELVKAGVFSVAENNRFRKCEDFLWAVRCHIHFQTGRAEERLSFDIQREIATRLGYTSHPGMKDVERFMKHYFLIAKDVGDLTRILCQELEEQHVKRVPGLNRFFRFGRRQKKLPESDRFVLDNNRINIAEPTVFEDDPVDLIRIFHLADKHNVAFHPDALHAIARSLKLIGKELRANEEANALFLDILTSRNDPETVLRRMNETGVLGRFVPDFGKIVAMMQFNMYHHYTVDEHLLRAIGILSEIERGELAGEHPLSDKLFPGLQDRKVLYTALFIHDIAKGRPEDHSIAGARIARRLGPRFGLDAEQTALVAWLVEEHLKMSIIAQSRDLNDRKTIADFAAIVQTLERLKLLLILTVADIKAVGPGVWNGWKGQLLRTLYYETELVLTGGHSEVSRDQRVAASREELAAALEGWSKREIREIQALHYPAYWLRVDRDTRIAHAEFLKEAKKAKKTFATSVSTREFEGITEITLLAPDHPRLLSIIAGACSATGANIVDAQIFTTTDGRAFDTIFVTREFDIDADELRRGERIGDLIGQVLAGEVKLLDAIASKAAKTSRRRLRAFTVETRILVNNDLSDRFTVLEVSGRDRPGLLYDLTRLISDLNLDIGSAHIATFGERFVDVFYVTDLTGQKVTNGSRKAAIRRKLAAAVEGPGAAKPRSKADRKVSGAAS